ncbi:MAG: hypothetical protein ACOZBW_10955 [Thermodesulfobacteriota bacterium]
MKTSTMSFRPITIARHLLVAAIILCASMAHATVIQKTGGGAPWTLFPGDFRLTPAFPDKASIYATFVFRPASGDFDLLKVTGRFPHARYMSFNLYDFAEATDFDALADVEIVPDDGSINPFYPGENRDAGNRSYTLWLVKEGAEPPKGAANIFFIPEGVETLSLFLRVYRPDKGFDNLGGVGLPGIEALKSDKSPAGVPDFGITLDAALQKAGMFILNNELLETWLVTSWFAGKNVSFHRVSDAGLFPNAHNEYIIAPLPQDYANKVAVITFTPPTFENTYEGGVFEGGKDVRYWSFCTGGLAETGTIECLCDDQVRKNPDGTVTICIAPLTLKRTVEKAGFNYMRWGGVAFPVLLHRHLLASKDFPGSISHVPYIQRPPAPEERNGQYMADTAVEQFMGEYGPTGRVFTVSEFLWWLWTR